MDTPHVAPRLAPALLALAAALSAPASTAAQPLDPAEAVVEATIAGLHQAMLDGRLTARQIVQAYLDRIEAYDRNGPHLNALITVNPRALEKADSLDALLTATGRLAGPLHGIPVIVKDNYDTRDMPTTAGSASLADDRIADDAFQVRRIREAGAIVLAKSNMAEFAFSPYETIGSALPGFTFNPYALNRVTAGSSGGTAAAVAASLGAVGLGTDTGNSIRGPSAHNALVGIRSTMGLTSRDGIVPLYLDRDIGGPMARTVEDAVRVFDVLAGTDPADAVTAEADARRPDSYLDFLDPDGLRGVRIGVLRQVIDSTAHSGILARFEEALDDLRAGGAVVVDDVRVPEIDTISGPLWCRRFRHDMDAYLGTRPDPRWRTTEELADSGTVDRTAEDRLRFLAGYTDPPSTDSTCVQVPANVETLRAGVRRAMERADVDALVYPGWDNPPRLVGDMTSPHGNNSPILSPPTGFPAVAVPMGWVEGGTLPAGLQILGDAWSEPLLIRIAYAYEQRTSHRKPPPTTPVLEDGTPGRR